MRFLKYLNIIYSYDSFEKGIGVRKKRIRNGTTEQLRSNCEITNEVSNELDNE